MYACLKSASYTCKTITKFHTNMQIERALVASSSLPCTPSYSASSTIPLSLRRCCNCFCKRNMFDMNDKKAVFVGCDIKLTIIYIYHNYITHICTLKYIYFPRKKATNKILHVINMEIACAFYAFSTATRRVIAFVTIQHFLCCCRTHFLHSTALFSCSY